MADTTLVNIRMDTELKRDLEETCRELGLNLTTAFTIFARKMTRERRIPFEVSVDPFYSAANLDHLRRVRTDAEAGRDMSTHELIEA
ncbi:MAG: type II toxin-antitoxin system RelB/DinJ family antitoxin [Propionibacteriaceae bacterium]|jgi:DNA-damage-inducible protein J|nr:type II toxin-antitoxin system RelB/DinJ family antitoxin [Propionibacteriaceae bacterium]